MIFLNNFYDFIFNNDSQSNRLHKQFLITIIVAFGVRCAMFWLVDYRFDVGDGRYYQDVAHNILQYQIVSGDSSTNPIPTMYRPPLYSFFLAGVSWLFGENPFYIQWVQIFLSIGTILFTTRISAFYFPKAVPYVFGLMAISPFEAVYSGAILSETLVSFLLVFSVCALLTFEGRKRFFLGGLALGLTILVRDIYLPFIIIFSIWITFCAEFNRSKLYNSLIFLIFACLVVAPWTIRNYQISQRFVPVSDGRLGLSLWLGTWATNGNFTLSDASGKPRIYPPEAFRNEHEKKFVEEAFDKGGKDGDLDLKAIAIQRIIENPADVTKVYLLRAPLLWLGTRFDIFQLNSNYFPSGSVPYVIAKSFFWGLNFMAILLAVFGMIVALRKSKKYYVLTIPILYTALIYFPLNGFENRYSQPVYPFILIFVGFGISYLKDQSYIMKLRKKYG